MACVFNGTEVVVGNVSPDPVSRDRRRFAATGGSVAARELFPLASFSVSGASSSGWCCCGGRP